MKLMLYKLIYLPALIFWVPFALCYRAANKIVQKERYMVWRWCNLEVVDQEIYEFKPDYEW